MSSLYGELETRHRYGTPFLLSLGLRSSSQVSSGLQVPSAVSLLNRSSVSLLLRVTGALFLTDRFTRKGAISDSSTSRYRRRFWIITSTAILCISTLMLAYCVEIATFFVDLFHGGLGDWDPKQKKQVANASIGFAVVAFYLLISHLTHSSISSQSSSGREPLLLN